MIASKSHIIERIQLCIFFSKTMCDKLGNLNLTSAGSDFYEIARTLEEDQIRTTKLQEMRCHSKQSLSPHILF
jgi:hypothetical protein